ncbi:DUF5312 family protein [Treponema sp.]|uniref:DUF5312 family protein n=1 Tax=Treponema sp. TaxID=166 RepID=UPI0025D708C4|nr:DUF5312 family protein [Treponema sp.]MCR5218238.1 DUF5312 domain-containing protein [Treponema sp.]
MAAENERSAFDRMVTTISDDERKDMLDKVSRSAQEEEDDDVSSLPVNEQEYKTSLSIRLQQESFLRRLWIKIKSALFNITPEDIYNTSLINHIAHDVEHTYPGLISHRRSVLTLGTYEKLFMIRKVQEFFMPYIESYESNPGLYYYYLSLVVMPEITEQIQQNSDPYKFPFTKNLTTETRVQLIKKIDDALDSLPESKRTAMYMCVRSIEWLKAFNRMHVDSLIRNFTPAKECLYNLSRSDFASIAKVMNVVNIPGNEALVALFSFYYNTTADNPNQGDEEQLVSEFINGAHLHIEEIRSFSSGLPVKDIARLVFDNALYDSRPFGGGEDWFVKFKSQWRINFDTRWNQWLFDYKKYRVQIKIKTYFDYDDLPLLPVRPWTKLWTGYPFRYELSMGFIWLFFGTIVKTIEAVLKTLMLEGDFVVKENSAEYTDNFRFLQNIRNDFAVFNASLSDGGEVAAALNSLGHSPDKDPSSRAGFTAVMNDVEDTAQSFIEKAGKWFRSMKGLIGAIVNGAESQYYGGLTNWSKIGGRQNKEFKENLSAAYMLIDHAYDILTEAEGLDSSSV